MSKRKAIRIKGKWLADKVVKTKAAKAKIAKAKAPSTPRGPGVIDSLVSILQSGGGTIPAMAEKLGKKFPDRKAAQLAATVRAQVNRLSKTAEAGGRGLKIKKARAEGERQVSYSL